MDLHHAKTVTLVALALLTVPLAGCADSGGGGGGDGAMFSSYDEAQDAPGRTLTPNGTSSPYRIKLLVPSGQMVDSQGDQEIVVLVYNSNTDQPVTDADFSADQDDCNDRDAFCAWMPAMGHGTAPETSPTHDAHGVYVGGTTWSMSGSWQLELHPEIDGNVVPFDAVICVQTCSR